MRRRSNAGLELRRLRITNRAYILYEGRIWLEGTSEQLATDPEARRLYLGDQFSL